MFSCSNCGYKSIKWLGRCPSCDTWESFVPEDEVCAAGVIEKRNSPPVQISEVKSGPKQRISTSIGELDRILGGGLVPGEVVLVGGHPGVGKSTLLLKAASLLVNQGKVLYVSAEESVEQLSLRAGRLGAFSRELYCLNEDNLEEVYRYVKEGEFDFLIIDSIQVVYLPGIDYQKGSVAQIKGCADFLTRIAKTGNTVVLIVGHVTKEGTIAGPKLLEHIVDCVLYFESETISTYRVLRAVKNRFGPAGEIAAFEMFSDGLREVKSLSELFTPHMKNPVPGSCIIPVIEGIRPIMLEVQSLVSKAGFGVVRRRALGFDFNRFSLLVAIIEKRLKFSFSSQDIFLNVSGGIKINDPSADMGASVAIISSYKDQSVSFGNVFIGEVGLGAEIRPVSNINNRIKEIQRCGVFNRVFIPRGNYKETGKKEKGIVIEPVLSLKEVLDKLY